MRLIYFVLLLGFTTESIGQTIFYDAQYFASITPKQINTLKFYADDTTHMDPTEFKEYHNLPIQQDNLSAEELATARACYAFLDNLSKTPDQLFTLNVQKDMLNAPLLKQILKKVTQTKGLSWKLDEYDQEDYILGGGSTGTTGISGLGNVFSRASSADFQNMLIDATATYLAESFKEDVVYTFFSKAQDKIKSLPEFYSLFPKTCDKISKLNPFNFNDLGNSWKQAFENDIQALPVNFRDFVKNGPADSWYGKLKTTDYFKYYSYSIDILQPLVKGYHPLEILEMLDRQYSDNTTVQAMDEYQGIVHFLNMLQAALQDTTKSTSKSGYNTWISFNQLKELNTYREQLCFFALLYLQDPAFFNNNGQLGTQIRDAFLKNDAAVLAQVIGHLPDFLILLNQVETSVSDINHAKSQKQNTTELVSTFIKNVLAILKQTNILLDKSGVDHDLTTRITRYLNYGDLGFALYNSITAKNYSALIDNSLQLLDSIVGSSNINNLVANSLPTILDAYNAILRFRGLPNVNQAILLPTVLENWDGKVIATESFLQALKITIHYADLGAADQQVCDQAIDQLRVLLNVLNNYLVHGSIPLSIAQPLVGGYNAVLTILNLENIDAPALVPILSKSIGPKGLDKKKLEKQLKSLQQFKDADSTHKSQASIAIARFGGLVDQVNVHWQANSQVLNRVVQIAAAIAKYGKIVALIANAQSADDLKVVIKSYVMPSGSYAIQRSSRKTFTISAMVGAIGSAESVAKADIKTISSTIRPNIGLTAPIGLEWSWGKKTNKPTKYSYLDQDGTTKYLTGVSHSVFIQAFDFIAPVNYRLTNETGSLPAKIQLAQLFSPGISYNRGFGGLPFDVGLGLQYTPSLRTIGAQPQANSLRLFLRISWVKPLIPISIK